MIYLNVIAHDFFSPYNFDIFPIQVVVKNDVAGANDLDDDDDDVTTDDDDNAEDDDDTGQEMRSPLRVGKVKKLTDSQFEENRLSEAFNDTFSTTAADGNNSSRNLTPTPSSRNRTPTSGLVNRAAGDAATPVSSTAAAAVIAQTTESQLMRDAYQNGDVTNRNGDVIKSNRAVAAAKKADVTEDKQQTTDRVLAPSVSIESPSSPVDSHTDVISPSPPPAPPSGGSRGCARTLQLSTPEGGCVERVPSSVTPPARRRVQPNAKRRGLCETDAARAAKFARADTTEG